MTISTLPCRIRPLAGETPLGFLGRLAVANLIPTPDLARYTARRMGMSTTNEFHPYFIAGIEQLGGLPSGYFLRDRAAILLWRRCHHHGWKLSRCVKCDVTDIPRRACLICSRGIPTYVASPGGGFCIRHDRWHLQERDVLDRSNSTARHGEQLLSGRLWARGITLHTGEISMALALIRDSYRESTRDPQVTFADVYGPALDLVFTLTDPAVASSLVTHIESPDRQVEALIGLTVGAGHGTRTEMLESSALKTVERHRSALGEALSMPRTRQRKHTHAQFEKAIAEAAYRQRAALLRHVTKTRVRAEPNKSSVRGAPASRTVSRRLIPGWMGRWDLDLNQPLAVIESEDQADRLG